MTSRPAALRSEAPRLVADVAAALMLLTRIPVRWERFSESPPDLARSAWANPVVGLLVGGIGACTLVSAAWLGLPALPASLLTIVAQCLATGAFHEDGLADVADGFGGGVNRQAKLEIMKDSRIGTFGGLAVVFSVGLRAAAIAELPMSNAALGLVAAGTVSRAAIVAMLWGLESARPEGLGAALRRPARGELVAAVILGVVPAVISLGPSVALRSTASGLAAVCLLSVVARRQIGGYTGDVLGAGQQACEVVFLLALAASSSAL